ncbi:MAG: aminotransferase class III-fold pyridoxal phosphate-dependent enzyme [Gammaproteobacteria bacterium]|nr:aminotransferase class III-fold pyridoxal phosphate-dependent enzyme [Gammaproteobacteria bacterium]
MPAGSSDTIQEEIFAAYRKLTPASGAYHERARRSLAGGTTGNLRYFPPYPFYETGGRGARVTDLDGNEYIDCFLCNGPLLLGHNHPDVIAAIEGHRETGPLVVNPPIIVDAAELVKDTVPCAERVRFLNSGTEAVIMAVRYARAFTGKDRVVKFYGHYHGQDDQFLTGLGPTAEPFGAGIPDGITVNTIHARYGDLAVLEQIIDEHQDIAAVMLDPAMHAGGLWGSSRDYLQAVREVTARRNIVLIFDEVITGFRLALGGGQAYYGVTPDLVTLGKAIAAGEKLAAVAGREDIMRVVDPLAPTGTPRVFQSGTANDGTTAIAASIGAINAYRDLDANNQYEHLFEIGERLAGGIRQAFRTRDIPCHVNQLGPMLQIFLSAEEPAFENYIGLDPQVLSLFFLALINEGVILTLPTSGHIYLSFAHTYEDIEEIIEKVNLVLDKYDFSSLT